MPHPEDPMTSHHANQNTQPDASPGVPRLHVVVGAGAVGAGVALRLAGAGHDVRIVTRSGSGPQHPRIERIAADASDAGRLSELARGAHALFNCANPSYSTWATAWPPIQAAMIAAAEASEARLVTMGNLYVYGRDASPMAATDPLDPPSKKGAIRAAMWEQAMEAHQAGRIRTTEVRASDFFGPGLGENGHLGDRFVPRLLAAKSASIVGRPDQTHSWSYIGDVCDTLAAFGNDDRSLGRAWHVPTASPATATEMANAICDGAAVERQKVRQIPGIALRLAGLFSADIRELREMRYQFDRPFVIDAAETTEVFGLRATRLDDQVAATIASYRDGQRDGTTSSSVFASANSSESALT
jgi:nucleoside-diphosphate-sugar epimerase